MTQATTDIAQAPQGKKAGLVNVDESPFANLLDTGKFEHMWRVASLFAKSQLVPAHFREKPEDCFIATQMAIRLGVDPMMMMQNTYIVQGKPGMQAVLAIALINSSGLFENSIDYEVEGSNPKVDPYRVRAWAVRKSTGKRVDGPWIDWSVVKAEGWDKKGGSKWMTIPGLMFMYRAAAWFGRLHCPERLMGMQTADEIEDVEPPKMILSTSTPKGSAGVLAKLRSGENPQSGEAATSPLEQGGVEGSSEVGQEPQNAADGQETPDSPLVASIDELYARWEKVIPAKKTDKRPINERFLEWVCSAAKVGIESTAEIDAEIVGRCHTVLDDIEGA